MKSTCEKKPLSYRQSPAKGRVVGYKPSHSFSSLELHLLLIDLLCASRELSTNSFTALAKSKTACPATIRRLVASPISRIPSDLSMLTTRQEHQKEACTSSNNTTTQGQHRSCICLRAGRCKLAFVMK